jgi:hypothetical protein
MSRDNIHYSITFISSILTWNGEFVSSKKLHASIAFASLAGSSMHSGRGVGGGTETEYTHVSYKTLYLHIWSLNNFVTKIKFISKKCLQVNS